MSLNNVLIVFFIGCGFFSASEVLASERKNEMDVSSKVFTLHLGSTRIIYNPDSAGETITVINDQDYPMLVQSEVLAEDRKTRAPFVVTPPLFRLDGRQSSRLKIIRNGGTYPSDRESLQWLCVKGIPPKANDQWAEDGANKKQLADKVSLQVQFSVSSCIKLLIRPSAVKGHPDDVAGQVEWQKKKEGKLEGINPTPFYMNLSELKVGGKNVEGRHFIAPFSSHEYKFPLGGSGKIQWQIITDYGGKSKVFEAELNQ